MGDVITALVFAAFSAEAFINDFTATLGDDDSWTSQARQHYPVLATTATALEQAEEQRKTTAEKFLIASGCLMEVPFKKDQRPYRDFRLLMAVRDTLAHHKQGEPGPVVLGPPDPTGQVRATFVTLPPPENKLLRQLHSLNILGDKGDYLGRLATPKVARWGCNTTAEIVGAVLTMLPAPGDSFIDHVRRIYDHFHPIP